MTDKEKGMGTLKKKTTKEKLEELEKKMDQLEMRKIRLTNQLKEKERKERTRRLIQVGAIFEKYFEIEGIEQAEKVALRLSQYVRQNKNELLKIDIGTS